MAKITTREGVVIVELSLATPFSLTIVNYEDNFQELKVGETQYLLPIKYEDMKLMGFISKKEMVRVRFI